MASPLRVTFVDEIKTSKIEKFQFGHSCLVGHSLMGEEKFSIELDKDRDEVSYAIYTISRPANPISVLTYPLVRYYQDKFRDESCKLMAKYFEQL